MESRESCTANISARGCQEPLDLDHLRRVTFGDRALACEVLQIFAQQSAMLCERIAADNADPKSVAALVHRLKGSARGVGAWRVAEAAETLEGATGGQTGFPVGLATLVAALEEAQAFIRALPTEN